MSETELGLLLVEEVETEELGVGLGAAQSRTP